MSTTQPITTAAQLLEATAPGPCELLRGELVMMTPAGFEHGRLVIRISVPLGNHVDQEALGVVTGAETGFQIEHDPDTVRAPDVAFVCAARVPAEPVKGFFQGAPDLAVEVISPNDRASDLLRKVHQWLAAGCRAVWVVDPATRTVSVYRDPKQVLVLSASDVLCDDDLLPGFRLPLTKIFGS